MELEAQSESSPVEAVQEINVEQPEQAPESYNIFSEEPGPVLPDNKASPVEDSPKKSKQFLENLKRDRQVRQQEIALKQRQQSLAQREQQVKSVIENNRSFKESPEEFMKSQGVDPMAFYKEWTERLLNTDGQPSVETQVEKQQRELAELKNKIQAREQNEVKAKQEQVQVQAFNNLCKDVEQYASSSDGYETIKDTCTAKDIVNGMVTHYRQTGEELTIEEAFEKIETGLRQREESFYKDPKILAKLQRYNPEASKTARGPQATLSARFKEQPTRTDPTDMSYEEIRDHWKGKLFT